MSWSDVGSIGVTPKDKDVLVGEFTLGEEHDTLFLRVTQTSPGNVWNYSFGLLTWRSTFGQELGTAKVYGSTTGECYQLGIGLPPVVRTGSLTFEPRGFNLAWVKRGNPWTLNFQVQSGSFPQGGVASGAVSNGFVSSNDGTGLQLVQVTFPNS